LRFFSTGTLPLIFLIQPLFAQNLVTTQEADRMVSYDDDSWPQTPHYEAINSRNNQCHYALNVFEPTTGERKTILKKDVLVSYTYDLLKREDQLCDQIVCEVAIGDLNGEMVVYFDYTLQTPDAYKHHGLIQEGRQIIIKLKNDTTVSLAFVDSAKGLLDKGRNETKYRTYTKLDDTQIEALKKSEAQRLLMPWSRGNEIYPISNPTLFIEQLTCLD